ncbi:MAG: colanic acid biosynthesis acetyltransferase WcaF [Cyanothece sp. SIO1E1]|nr:colanic acid biosynthesis acetyltransferase WcaF [Cyanothece sp. SIO1E1]
MEKQFKEDENKVADLSTFKNGEFNRGAATWKEILWIITSSLVFNHQLAVINSLKVVFLRFFGAKVGHNVVIKPTVFIKFPWKLSIGNDVWIGEKVWIDNLDEVIIEDNTCISQGAMLLCGNHNFSTTSFDLITKPITIKHGAWVGAKATVCPGVTLHSHAVLTVGSIATKDLEPYCIYQGNPAKKIKSRVIE